jgi:site-specific DNA-cytosine methylase
MAASIITPVEIRHFHLFAGLGGGAKGFNRGKARVSNLEARFRCIGGVDVDPMAMRDFERMAGTPGTVLDLFDREQYRAFWGKEPPAGWREATPADIRRAAGNERPHIVFLSAPCKGFSGLLPEAKSKTDKYQALNRLTTRGVWLMLEAWADDPPELIVFENVPRLLTRGRPLVDQITSMLSAYNYGARETVHDCGKLGGLAQSRKRCLIVARHLAKVPAGLYEPEQRPLRAVGDVLGRMPLPGDPRGGPMHRIPELQFRTWVRLAFVKAGSDWRSLNDLAVENGHLRDYLLVPSNLEAWHPNVLGVNEWNKPAGTVTSEARPTTGRFAVADPRTSSSREGSGYLGVRQWREHTGVVAGESRPSNGAFSVADPRVEASPTWNAGQQYGVHAWNEATGTIGAQQWPNQGRFAVADPRVPENDFHGFRVVGWNRPAGTATSGTAAPGSNSQSVADPRCGGVKHNNCFRVVRFDQAAGTVTGGGHPSAGGQSVADPRPHPGKLFSKYPVANWDEASRTVIGGDDCGAYAVGDPRPDWKRHGNNLVVGSWDEPARTVIAGGKGVQGGWLSIADPRPGMDVDRDAYATGGHYGVVPWDGTSGAVSAAACHDNGRWSVADPRPTELPAANQKMVARIISEDGTWHRPFSTCELAALQSLINPEDHWSDDPKIQAEIDLMNARALGIKFAGESDSAWRERIGNAVPPDAAEAIASEMGRTLLNAWSGETFELRSTPIWVRQVAIAISVAQPATF